MTTSFGASSTAAAHIDLHPSRSDGFRLPRGMREEAESAPDLRSWHDVCATYSPTTGPLRLGNWECTDADSRAGRLGPQARTFRATLALGDRIDTATASASGPVGALTAMLYERGIPLEMLSFHQRESDGDIATFVQGTDGARRVWAMGLSDDAGDSALRAVIACANRLLAAR